MFSKKAKTTPANIIEEWERWFDAFLRSTEPLDKTAFQSQNKRFSIAVFESVFCAVLRTLVENPGNAVIGEIDPASITALREDRDFMDATMSATTNTSSVETRLRRAKELIKFLPSAV
jgi:hypothetical protein